MLFGLDVERAGEIVHDQQGRLAHKHARGGGSLCLPAGEAHATRADHRFQPVLQARYIWRQDGGLYRRSQPLLARRRPKEDILA